MEMPLLAYSMYDLGDGWHRNEIMDRHDFLLYNGSLKTNPLKLGLSAYDNYRGELSLELVKANGGSQIFAFYNQDAINLFFRDLGINSINELKNLEDKRSLEGIFKENSLVGISVYNKIFVKNDLNKKYGLSCSEISEELEKLKEINLAKPMRAQGIEVNFIKESDKVHNLVLDMQNGLLDNYNLDGLIDAKEKLENSVDMGIELIGECAGIFNDDDYSTPNFGKYLEYTNRVITMLEREIYMRGEK